MPVINPKLHIERLIKIVEFGLLKRHDKEITIIETPDNMIFSIPKKLLTQSDSLNKNQAESIIQATHKTIDGIPEYYLQKAIDADQSFRETGLHTTESSMKQWLKQLKIDPTARVPECHL